MISDYGGEWGRRGSTFFFARSPEAPRTAEMCERGIIVRDEGCIIPIMTVLILSSLSVVSIEGMVPDIERCLPAIFCYDGEDCGE